MISHLYNILNLLHVYVSTVKMSAANHDRFEACYYFWCPNNSMKMWRLSVLWDFWELSQEWQYTCHFTSNLLFTLVCQAFYSRGKVGNKLSMFHFDNGGTAAAAPLPFRPGKPSICGTHPVVNPYYCRLGDLLFYIFVSLYRVLFHISVCIMFCALFVFSFVCSFLLQYFDTVDWVFWPVKTVSHKTYTVLEGT